MKKLITLSLVLCLSLVGFSQNERINQVAKQDLVSYLNFIPEGFEKQHGFNNRAEFAKATIGSQYEIMALAADGRLSPTKFFYVVVRVGGEYRALLTVGEVDGKLEIQSVGASPLAGELQAVEQKQNLSEKVKNVLVNDYNNKCSLVSYQEQGTRVEDAVYIPLASTKSFLEQSSTVQSSYKLPELVNAIATTSK